MQFVQCVQFVQFAKPNQKPTHRYLRGRNPSQNALSPTFSRNIRCIPVPSTANPVRLSSGGVLLLFLSSFCRDSKKIWSFGENCCNRLRYRSIIFLCKLSNLFGFFGSHPDGHRHRAFLLSTSILSRSSSAINSQPFHISSLIVRDYQQHLVWR